MSETSETSLDRCLAHWAAVLLQEHEKETITVGEAAAILRRNKLTVYDLIRRGVLHPVPMEPERTGTTGPPRRYRLDRAEVLRRASALAVLDEQRARKGEVPDA